MAKERKRCQTPRLLFSLQNTHKHFAVLWPMRTRPASTDFVNNRKRGNLDLPKGRRPRQQRSSFTSMRAGWLRTWLARTAHHLSKLGALISTAPFL